MFMRKKLNTPSKRLLAEIILVVVAKMMIIYSIYFMCFDHPLSLSDQLMAQHVLGFDPTSHTSMKEDATL